ncbi:MAG: hypothetical protein H7A35_04315 [Planctomycetales bacterium]|nr:hypothetical protein [bacterium]UNM09281.1 MAG: hypothetical protein H7A35_04315 [Planctomycetales bacterium]
MSVQRLLPVVIFMSCCLLAACGGSASVRTDAALQPVPADAVLPGLPSDLEAVAPRSGSVFQSLQLEADQWYAISDGVAGGGGNAILQPDGAPAWAMYQLPGVGEDYVPLNIARYIVVPTGSCWFAVANYKTGRWEFTSYGNQLGQSFAYGDNWQDYASPGGFVYCLVLATAGQCHVDYINFQVDNNLPPEPPANLTATPGELSALLEWDAVQDARVSELRIYHSLDSSMAGASLLGTVGPGLTQKLYEDLDHTVLHYFTIRSYVIELDQESVDSNIASCQPSGPVADTFLPPANLAASPGPQSAQLSWDPYTDPRASHIRVYVSENSDMSAASLEAELDPSNTNYTVEGLVEGTTFYFALTAWWQAALLESDYSNIADCVPGAAPFELMDGVWPRFGGDITSSGYSSVAGPLNLRNDVIVSLSNRSARDCGTSPVIDANGRVYGLSQDGILVCYPANLSLPVWKVDANDALADRVGHDPLGIPSQAPLLDSAGNIYFVGIEDDGERENGQGWLLSFDKDGEYRWRFDLGVLPTDPRRPAADLNIVPGAIICAGKDNTVLFGIDQDGNELWNNATETSEGRHFHADIAMDGNGEIGMPLWLDGIWIDPRPHWDSLSASDGLKLQEYKQLGSAQHILGGIYLPNGFFYYPAGNKLRSIDPADGSVHDEYEGIVNMSGSPARSGDGQFLFFAEDQGGGFSGFASFHCNSFNDDNPPTQNSVWGVSTGLVTVSCKPAVDVNLTCYFTDDTGAVHRIAWNPDLPIGDGNPLHSSAVIASGFHRSSIALAEGRAYVISTDNKLYMLSNDSGLPD